MQIKRRRLSLFHSKHFLIKFNHFTALNPPFTLQVFLRNEAEDKIRVKKFNRHWVNKEKEISDQELDDDTARYESDTLTLTRLGFFGPKFYLSVRSRRRGAILFDCHPDVRLRVK